MIDRRDHFLQRLYNHSLLLRSARFDRRLFLLRNAGSLALIDRDPDRGRDATFEYFDSKVVYLSKAGQQAQPALILNRGLVDEMVP